MQYYNFNWFWSTVSLSYEEYLSETFYIKVYVFLRVFNDMFHSSKIAFFVVIYQFGYFTFLVYGLVGKYNLACGQLNYKK